MRLCAASNCGNALREAKPVLFTFHKIREQGEQGNADAWRAFLDFYSPAFLRLLEINGAISALRDASAILKRRWPSLRPTAWRVFAPLPANRSANFSETFARFCWRSRLHRLHQAMPRSGRRASKLKRSPNCSTDLPLLHKEMLFFKLAGYTDDTHRANHAHLAARGRKSIRAVG